jgi:hypothetical protein
MAGSELAPVVLNDQNDLYGEKSQPLGWADLVRLTDELDVRVYRAGIYDGFVNQVEPELLKMVATKPEKMTELDLMKLYLLGKSHVALDQLKSAVGCFKAVVSQEGFRKYMLPEYRKYLDYSLAELEEIGQRVGYDKVNALSLHEFLGRTQRIEEIAEAKKGGCFIATAAYGSPLAEEVGILCEFRDRVLARSSPGRGFIRLYYLLSPQFAAFIGRHEILKRTVRACIVAPLVGKAKAALART